MGPGLVGHRGDRPSSALGVWQGRTRVYLERARPGWPAGRCNRPLASPLGLAYFDSFTFIPTPMYCSTWKIAGLFFRQEY
ncbi:hypothetical protein TorRG33x02_118740 [Trema orientale]|uniref:Uncharacterized protein n=1 Tax=Trema orientale TaxID=63057 RepID=A0A2P5F3Q3_TREOI|nr:hypothetical protein TorRG33x02_118740 [Trema orientale]